MNYRLMNYGSLLRIHHWIKYILIFVPLFFSSNFLNLRYAALSGLGFIAFSLMSSVVYIVNDMRDREKDRLHSTKCRRPLASGAISPRAALITIGVLSLMLIALILLWRSISLQGMFSIFSPGLLVLYLLLNIGYSWGLKNIPLVEVTILASGYVIRVLFGAVIIGVTISVWLYLMITLGAYYLGLGKRRNECLQNENTRTVMRFYSHNFLDKNMYMCQALCVVFYALWSIDAVTVQRFNTSAFVYTIPLVLLILLKYSLNIEGVSDGDPTSVILHDKTLLLLCTIYAVWAFLIIYAGRMVS
jgi:4-hydroxybenzoate polyprenyltransferase